MIIKSLEHTIDELHWVGHNVIYAALSLLAMKELQKWGDNQDIKGITNLILSFRKQFLVDVDWFYDKGSKTIKYNR